MSFSKFISQLRNTPVAKYEAFEFDNNTMFRLNEAFILSDRKMKGAKLTSKEKKKVEEVLKDLSYLEETSEGGDETNMYRFIKKIMSDKKTDVEDLYQQGLMGLTLSATHVFMAMNDAARSMSAGPIRDSIMEELKKGRSQQLTKSVTSGLREYLQGVVTLSNIMTYLAEQRFILMNGQEETLRVLINALIKSLESLCWMLRRASCESVVRAMRDGKLSECQKKEVFSRDPELSRMKTHGNALTKWIGERRPKSIGEVMVLSDGLLDNKSPLIKEIVCILKNARDENPQFDKVLCFLEPRSNIVAEVQDLMGTSRKPVVSAAVAALKLECTTSLGVSLKFIILTLLGEKPHGIFSSLRNSCASGLEKLAEVMSLKTGLISTRKGLLGTTTEVDA